MALTMLRKADVSFNLKKCCVFTDSVKYVEHIIKHCAQTIVDTHVKSLNQLQHPWNLAKMRSFIGMWNLHRRFALNDTDIADLVPKFLQ